MEKLLNQQIADQVRQVFDEDLGQPVEILFFHSRERCEFCEPTRSLLEEVTQLSSRLSLRTIDVDEDAETAARHRVDKVPGIVLAYQDGDLLQDPGVRFAGMPSGHEFSSLINSILMVSQRRGPLSDETREFLSGIEQDILLQVFVTPT